MGGTMARSKKLTKRHVIVLYGEANSGKTTVLKELGQMLLENCDDYSNNRVFLPSKDGVRSTVERDIKCTWRGCKLLIRTMGDQKSVVKKNIDAFLGQEFDIAITASRWPIADLYDKKSMCPKKLSSCEVHDMPRIKRGVGEARVMNCYTTSEELYLHLVHLQTTGNFD